MKKGRHRRYEEARQAKRAFNFPEEKCVECGGDSQRGHASWCLAGVDEIEDEEELDQERPASPSL